jgi:hypothetical protein
LQPFPRRLRAAPARHRDGTRDPAAFWTPGIWYAKAGFFSMWNVSQRERAPAVGYSCAGAARQGPRGQGDEFMALWQRLLITLAAIFGASFLAGYASANWLGLVLPAYVSGVIGGLVALPVWELLKWIGGKKEGEPPEA